jgi:HTH-type transcriptional regulator, sugar sensing transcriptional regulator
MSRAVPSHAHAHPHENLAERLVRLGFSQYEARAYLGLLSSGEQTGYALANLTRVPQPKIYETLRRLLERGAVVQTSARPARYQGIPSETLLAGLEQEFLARVRAAREDLARLPRAVPDGRGLSRRLAGWDQVLASALAALAAARTKVYLSGRSPELQALEAGVHGALAREVRLVLIHFGPLPFGLPAGRCQAIRHASTEGTLDPSHRSHHLALVADSRHAVWAFAREGASWQGIAADDEVLATAIKGYIRHDIMIQRIYADLPAELTQLYGPGLLQLGSIASGEAPVEPAATERAV